MIGLIITSLANKVRQAKSEDIMGWVVGLFKCFAAWYNITSTNILTAGHP